MYVNQKYFYTYLNKINLKKNKLYIYYITEAKEIL